MHNKILIEGDLLAQCELNGNIRYGMLRVAEELTKKLLLKPEVNLDFANFDEVFKNYIPLKTYIDKQKSANTVNIINPYRLPVANNALLRSIYTRVNNKLKIQAPLPLKKYDLFHSFYNPFSSTIEKSSIKKSITFLDIIPLRMDGYPKQAIDITKKIVESIVPNYAIAISNFSKEDLCDYDKRVNPDNVFVAPLAADPNLFFVNKHNKSWEVVKAKYALPDHYYLSISSTDQRKNLNHVISSFDKLLLQEKTNDLFLVLTGNSVLNKDLLNKIPISDSTRAKIIIPPPIDEQDLSVVYSRALGFVFMSLYEGFGLPVLEAMQCGTPVIASSTTSIPEVVEQAGILIDPTDQDALAQSMLSIFEDKERRENYSILGLKQAKKFSWQKCADEYINIFNRICN